MITVPLKTTGSNAREIWQQRSRRVKKERHATGWMLRTVQRPEPPCAVLLIRLAPSAGLDDDNLRAALKGVRDEIAAWLGVDDRSPQVRYCYAQGRGPWSVMIEFGPIATTWGGAPRAIGATA